MAGEQYAKISIKAALSRLDSTREEQTRLLRFTLAGQVESIQGGAGPTQFLVPDPDTTGVGDEYALQAIKNLLAVLRGRIGVKGLPYVVSEPRLAGTMQETVSAFGHAVTFTVPLIEFDITATDYGRRYNLDFSAPQNAGWSSFGWTITQVLGNISPITATAAVTPATVFGRADGAIDVTGTATDIYVGAFFGYTWDDGFYGASRTQLRAGTYGCTVAYMGASTRVVVEVKSAPQLVVQVTNTPNSITLLVSGGVAPYTVRWDDGDVTLARTNLPEATYHYLVTDAHGATGEGDVVLSFNSRYWFSGNPVTLSLDAGPAYRADPTTKPGLGFVCQVWVERAYLSGTFEQVGQELEQPADAGGRTTFEVQELLEPFVAPLVPVPHQPDVQRQDGAFCRFFLRYFERTAAGDGTSTTVATNYLLHGGLGYTEAATGTWFNGYQKQRLPFLTWEPTTKKVLPDQPEYLFFMVPAVNLAGFSYRLRLRWADGATTDLRVADRTGLLRYEVFCLPAGPVQLDLPAREAAAGQLVVSYTLDVLDDTGAPLSEARTFVLDRRPCPVRRYFLYANSLGGWNTLVCRGRAARELATKTSSSENARAAGYDPLRGDYSTSRRTGLPVLKCYTGARSAAQLAADADFMLSERVLLLEADRYLAGQVKDRTFTPYDEDETRRVVQFDFELPRERYHTPALTL
jgi:hypothetical protein